ncbi:hypothetical protein ACIO7M_33235 [Streptomyces toxytricini]|uniref:Uncharacterized protein n=1 Tax=Streptomyces toxytricini TaxID=67369 RepID=A0ABW8ERN7_STRT5
MVARLVRQHELDVRVEFRGFGFQESDDALVPVPFPDDLQWGVFLQGHVRRFDLFSAGHTHTASVTARVWDGEPEDDAGEWEEQAEVDFESVSGEVAVWSSGRGDGLVRLGRGGMWRVRARCKGRAEVERVTRSKGTAWGVERYVIDFWPKAG